MNSKFEGVSTAGIINPGDLYIIFEEPNRGGDPGPIDFIYAIRKDEDILPALDMEMCMMMAESYELIRFEGVTRISSDCHEFKMFVYDKEDDEEREWSLYLHRIVTFEEKLQAAKELFLEE
jgi:hypothetical protein